MPPARDKSTDELGRDLLFYRVNELERRSERIEEAARDRERSTSESFRETRGDCETSVCELDEKLQELKTRVDMLLVKIGIWSTICGGLGMLLVKAYLDKMTR